MMDRSSRSGGVEDFFVGGESEGPADGDEGFSMDALSGSDQLRGCERAIRDEERKIRKEGKKAGRGRLRIYVSEIAKRRGFFRDSGRLTSHELFQGGRERNWEVL